MSRLLAVGDNAAMEAERKRRWYQFRPSLLRSIVVFLIPMFSTSCSQHESLQAKRPVRADGEVFLQGPDVARTKVSLGRTATLALCELIDSGAAAHELKDQGLAVFTITYETGGREEWQIGQSGVAWCEKGAVQTDINKLLPLLRDAVDRVTAAAPR